jgi:hypothetical protein
MDADSDLCPTSADLGCPLFHVIALVPSQRAFIDAGHGGGDTPQLQLPFQRQRHLKIERLLMAARNAHRTHIEAAVAGIVVGLISIFSLGAFAVAAILSIASLITGIIAKKKGAGAAGLVLSIIAVILCALMGAVSAVEFCIGFVKGFVNGLNMGMGGI